MEPLDDVVKQIFDILNKNDCFISASYSLVENETVIKITRNICNKNNTFEICDEEKIIWRNLNYIND
jgi:hypothetical protein